MKPRPRRSAVDLAPILGVVDATRSLFHHLKAAAETLHGEGEASAARRGILESLERLGPQTVPALARARPVSRQHVQTVVNGLTDDALVEVVDNPAHRRSGLVRLTALGSERLAAIREREAPLLAALGRRLPKRELERTRAALETLRDALAQELERSHAAR